LRLAVSYEIPSLESEFVASTLRMIGDVTYLDPWNPEAHMSTFDVAVCVGPVRCCPPMASRKVLVALGTMASQCDLGWNVVMVTSRKAAVIARARFGIGVGIVFSEPPVLGLHHGRRRLMDEFRGLIHASEYGSCAPRIDRLLSFCMWAERNEDEHDGYWCIPGFGSRDWDDSCPYGGPKARFAFSPNDFNSAVRGGAVGFYPPWMEDGYDLQVRRHLCLGGAVMCPRDKEVLGDLADLCCDIKKPMTPSVDEAERHDPMECSGDADAWAEAICEAVRRA
jgi:hypothetical protein